MSDVLPPKYNTYKTQMLLPDLKNNHEGQWMLWNPPRASSVTVATSSAGLGQVHLSSPWFQEPPGCRELHGLCPVIQCVPFMLRTRSELSWIPTTLLQVCTYTHITPHKLLYVHTHTHTRHTSWTRQTGEARFSSQSQKLWHGRHQGPRGPPRTSQK